jgi:hypothetical protein
MLSSLINSIIKEQIKQCLKLYFWTSSKSAWANWRPGGHIRSETRQSRANTSVASSFKFTFVYVHSCNVSLILNIKYTFKRY